MKVIDYKSFKEDDILNLINYCLEENIIKIKDEGIVINRKEKVKVTEEWIKTWNDLFPLAKDTYDRTTKRDPIKGKYGVLKKMQDFINEFDYDLDTIMLATKMYLKEESTSMYRYTKRSAFFISKRPEASRLAAECDRYLSEGNRIDKLDNLIYGD